MTMLQLFNNAIASSPEWSDSDSGPPGLAINNILTSVVITPAGFATFCSEKVNEKIRDVLNVWKTYLETEDSAYVLTTDPNGWLSPNAIEQFSEYLPNKDFITAFGCDTTKPHWGFNSWDDFFARDFANIDETRPVSSPNDDSVIVNACESTAYNTASNVAEFSTFWLKGETYALKLMLNNDELAPQFYGGSVYQAFLNVTDYHRYHSPVSGTIKKCYVVQGNYYALAPDYIDRTVAADSEEITSIIEAQSYLSIVATRALVFIEADNKDIGLMCFIAVGMVDVSSCEITVQDGQRVNKGDPLGSFHFGGSTHCLVFGPQTKLTWTNSVLDKEHIAVRSAIGAASAASGA
jgi:phosphatidylserine decarboxylase